MQIEEIIENEAMKPATAAVSEENKETVKKVRIAKPRRAAAVKVKTVKPAEENTQEAPATEEVQLSLPLETEAEKSEGEVKPRRKYSKKNQEGNRRQGRHKIGGEIAQIAEEAKPEVESAAEDVPSTAVESESALSVQEAAAPASSEESRRPEAEAAEGDNGQEQKTERGDNRRDRYNNRNNKNQKYQNNNKKDKYNKNRRQVEEYPAEINALENPEAPRLFLSELLKKDLDTLRDFAREKGISEEEILECRKQDLIQEILKHHSAAGGVIMSNGTVEVMSDGYGLLRYAENSYLASSEDVYISQNQVKQNGLRTGDQVFCQVRTPRDYDRSYVIFKVINVNGDTPQTSKLRAPFDSLTPLFPDEKLHLEVIDSEGKADISTRVVDLFCPIGKGQRSLIVAPPRTGKTVLMQKIANSITANHPEVELIVLLVDERPEEVTDMRRHVHAEVVASTFDEQATRHVQVAEMVIEKAKRLVEYHKDVVILLDSITRLARAYNQTVPASGKILSGGVDSNALHKPKRFFGAARNIENGGSLTIISTALIETGSRMDEVIFEEFKGTGNNEIVLDRRMADSRKFPAINIKKSGTRRDDLLLTKDEQTRIWLLRNAVANMDDVDMSVFLIDKMKKNSNNKEFLASISSAAVSSADNGLR
jgi:transcription termination factor Rho